MSSEDNSSFTFVWILKNFNVFTEKGSDYFESPGFTSAILGNSEFVLFLHPYWEELLSVSIECKKGTPPTKGNVELFIDRIDGTQVTRHFDIKLLANSYESLTHNRASIFKEAELFLPDNTLTVGCRIKKVSEMFQTEKWIAQTETSTGQTSVTFPFYNSGMQQLITVPLSTGNQKYPDFKIMMDSYFRSAEPLTIYMEMAESSFRVFAMCHLCLEDADGNVKYLVDEERWFEANKDGKKWELKNSLSKNGQEALCKYSFHKHSVYTLHCRLNLTDGKHTSSIVKKVTLPVEESQKSSPDSLKLCPFKEKLKNLYTDKRLCDFTIQVNGKQFPVHKTILGTVSPVFCAMFERDMKEKESSLLTVEDIDADTMERLIDFAYFESIDDLQWDHAVKLYSAADKYQIPELKQRCVSFMIPKITIENVTEALILSDLHQDKNLEKATKSFIFDNAKQLLHSSEWKVFMENNMKVANKIMHEVCIKMCENQI